LKKEAKTFAMIGADFGGNGDWFWPIPEWQLSGPGA
jgi:hypothetical protein